MAGKPGLEIATCFGLSLRGISKCQELVTVHYMTCLTPALSEVHFQVCYLWTSLVIKYMRTFELISGHVHIYITAAYSIAQTFGHVRRFYAVRSETSACPALS